MDTQTKKKGVEPIYDAPMKPRSLFLPDSMIDYIDQQIGNDRDKNRSWYVRQLIEQDMDNGS